MPLPSTRQSHMDVFRGKAPCLDDNKQIDNISYMQEVVAKTADYTVLVKESGTCFTTTGSTGSVTFTLPAVASSAGCVYWFANEADFVIRLTAPAGTLVASNSAALTSVSFEGATQLIGQGFMAICNGTKWFAFNYAGQTDSAVTVA